MKKIVFFGSSQFAVPILDKLAGSKYKPSFVVTEPDAPAGRKRELKATAVAELAKKLNIKLLKFDQLNQVNEFIKKEKPDLCIVAAYGKIIPKKTLNIPKYGFINIHPSLLPKHRGPSPIQTAILVGEKTTGVTIIKMDEKVDHGPILSKIKYPMSGNETYLFLSEKLSKLASKLLLDTLPKYLEGEIRPKPQNHSKASFTKLLTREDGHIDWNKSAQEIERMSRAFEPWPGTWSLAPSKKQSVKLRVKLLKISVLNPFGTYAADNVGRTFLTSDKKLAVNCKIGSILIEKLQLEGSKPQSYKDFLIGHPDFVGLKLT